MGKRVYNLSIELYMISLIPPCWSWPTQPHRQPYTPRLHNNLNLSLLLPLTLVLLLFNHSLLILLIRHHRITINILPIFRHLYNIISTHSLRRSRQDQTYFSSASAVAASLFAGPVASPSHLHSLPYSYQEVLDPLVLSTRHLTVWGMALYQ
ncbi:hypothetical protein K440DRAFT_36333 [Wilcoxina mikolae CBS 423.85]|nr:hypothetical protein K440DRAFT_36333 [Wilcoxina mikolae CBS 423.85]